MEMDGKEKQDFFDNPGNIRKLWILLYVVCGVTVLMEIFAHRHPHFGFDGFFGFYAILGFAACAVLILVAKGIGFLLKKNEDYYD